MTSINHERWTALAIALNSDSGLSVAEYDEFCVLLYHAKCRLTWIAEQRGCKSCAFFGDGCSKADNKMPPEKIQKTGCEQYENKHIIPF
jgi:hypothetical protein